MKLTEAEFQAMLHLYNEFNSAYLLLPIWIRSMFVDDLMSRG